MLHCQEGVGANLRVVDRGHPAKQLRGVRDLPSPLAAAMAGDRALLVSVCYALGFRVAERVEKDLFVADSEGVQ